MPPLSFTLVHSYSSYDAGVTVPVVLRSGAQTTDLLAILDTGASH